MPAPSFPPASFFGMPVGMIALGLAWRSATSLWHLPEIIPELIVGAGGLVWLLLMGLYAAKWIYARDTAAAEIGHPVAGCFLGLAPVGATLLSVALHRYSTPTASALLLIGATATIGFALVRTGRFWGGGRAIEDATPVLYFPAVAGGFVTATGLAQAGYADWGKLALGAGFFSWLMLESVVLHRLLHGPSLPLALRPTLGIQLAPPTVGALAYLTVNGGQSDTLVQAMTGYALLQALILVRLVPWLRQPSFTASYWSFSFGAAALASVTIRLASTGASVERSIAPYVFILVNLLIGWLAVSTVSALARGRRISGEPKPIADPAVRS